VPATWYDAGKSEVLNGGIALLTDTIKAMLVGPSYVFSLAHSVVTDLGAVEISGTGYAGGFGGTGRKALASKTVTKDTVNHRAFFDAADITWVGLNAGTVAAIVLIKEVTDDAHSKLLAYVDVTDYLTVGIDSIVAWDPAGILWLT
jgi:hypothetical protein